MTVRGTPGCGCPSFRAAAALIIACIAAGATALNTSSPSCSVPRAPSSSQPLPTCQPSNKTLQDAAQGEGAGGNASDPHNPCLAPPVRPLAATTDCAPPAVAYKFAPILYNHPLERYHLQSPDTWFNASTIFYRDRQPANATIFAWQSQTLLDSLAFMGG